MATEKKPWVKDLLVAFAATTLSIILTFGTTGVINRVKQKQERRLTALMVMSSIEQFARDLEEIEEDLAYKDSLATWLLSLTPKDVTTLGNDQLEVVYHTALDLIVATRDKTSETIFSSHIDTWKNMGNFKFIDNVGWCFSYMDLIAKDYNSFVNDITAANNRIVLHPNDYPGNTKMEKLLRDEEIKSGLKRIHHTRGYLSFNAVNLRMENRNNMRLIGISEKEVMDFTDNLGAADDYEEDVLSQFDFDMPEIDADSVAAHISIPRQLDSLLKAKKGM